jgi:hypothetical protein
MTTHEQYKEPEMIDEFISVDEQTFTMSVPEAGKRYFGLSRGASYAAAERGEIPTIRIGDG